MDMPTPLKLDLNSSVPDPVIVKKKSSLSLFRKRRDSRASSTKRTSKIIDEDDLLQTAGAGPSSNPEDVYGPHIMNGEPVEELDEPPAAIGNTQIAIEEAVHDGEQKKDLFRWAVMYENQRGFTLFSTPHYGSRSLLPNDPAPFTIPSLSPGSSTSSPSPCTLRDFQLPDACWAWVSKHWMVDMRGDGDVCSEGFEYNWSFRSNGKGWRPHPGSWIGAGGWVRRRRWLRLMMRPADARLAQVKEEDETETDVGQTEEGENRTEGDHSSTRITVGAEARTWQGDPMGDWERCHHLLRSSNRDGRRLELWRDWLGVGGTAEDSMLPDGDYINATAAATAKGAPQTHYGLLPQAFRNELQPTPSSAAESDVFFTPNALPLAAPEHEWITAVLRQHGSTILSLFMFPDSRAHFIELLENAGIDTTLVTQIPDSEPSAIAPSPTLPEFWSQNTALVYADDVPEGVTTPNGRLSNTPRNGTVNNGHATTDLSGKDLSTQLMTVSFGGKEVLVKESQSPTEREYVTTESRSRSGSQTPTPDVAMGKRSASPKGQTPG